MTSQTAQSISGWIGPTPPGVGDSKESMEDWNSLSDKTSPEPQRAEWAAGVRRKSIEGWDSLSDKASLETWGRSGRLDSGDGGRVNHNVLYVIMSFMGAGVGPVSLMPEGRGLEQVQSLPRDGQTDRERGTPAPSSQGLTQV